MTLSQSGSAVSNASAPTATQASPIDTASLAIGAAALGISFVSTVVKLVVVAAREVSGRDPAVRDSVAALRTAVSRHSASEGYR